MRRRVHKKTERQMTFRLILLYFVCLNYSKRNTDWSACAAIDKAVVANC